MLCNSCLKSKKLIVNGDGDPASKFWVIGQNPGSEELNQGKPFVGPSGQLLFQTLQRLGIRRDDVYVDNVQRCFDPPGAELDFSVVSHCVKHIWSLLKRYTPDVVLVLGHVAASALLFFSKDSDKIYEYRGYPIHKTFGGKKVTFIPTFHPAKVLRERQTQQAHYRLFSQDLSYAVHLIHNPLKDHTVSSDHFLFPGSVDDVKELFKKLISMGRPVAFDFETSHLRPYWGQFVTMAFSNGYLTFGFDYTKLGQYLTDTLIEFFQSDLLKIAHNLQFESEWIYQKFKILISPPYEDTMLLAHSLRPHKVRLKDLAHSFLKVDDWEIDVKKDVTKIDRKELLVYNCYDAYYTLCLYNHLKPIFDKHFPSASKWAYTYANWVRDLPVYISKSQVDGVCISKPFLKQLETQYLTDLKEVLAQLYKFVSTDLTIPEFDLLPGEDNLDKLVFVYSVTKESPYYKLADKVLKKIFNFRSIKQVAEFLTKQFKVSIPLTEKGNPCLDDYVLNDLLKQSTSKELKEFLLLLRRFRDILKNLKTYVVNIYPLIAEDGRIHTNYRLFGARTGRFSSSNPNLQNWPKRKNIFARDLFVAPPGKIFLKVDYSSLEVRVLQMYAEDPLLGDYLRGGGDMHFDASLKLFCTKEKAQEERGRAKNGIVFPVFYGAGFQTVREAFLDLPEDHVKKVYDWLRKRFKRVIEWQQEVWDFYCKFGYVEAFHGYKRWMPMNFNMVINHPIQSFASFLMWSAWVDLLKKGYEVPLYIHDELGIIIDDTLDSLKAAITDLRHFLLNRPFKVLQRAPLDFDTSLGYAYGSLKKFNWKLLFEDEKAFERRYFELRENLKKERKDELGRSYSADC